tara:strand:- start:198 stop:1982 length:1785 start_codon:yes stop_codon:yes gene_type:complete
MKKFLIFILLFIVACTGNKIDEAEIKEANQFFESIFLDAVQDSPEFQTRLGYKSNYDKWDSFGWKKIRDEAKEANYDLKYLHDNINYEKLDDATKVSYRMLENRLERKIKASKFVFNDYPVTHRGGKHSSIPSFLINYHNIDNEEDVKAYLRRLSKVETLMDGFIKELKLRQDVQVIAPNFVYPQAIKVCKNIISGFPFEETEELNVIYDDFTKKLDKIELSDPIKTRYKSEAQAILLTSFNSGYRKLINFLLKQEKLDNDSFGVWKQKDGAEYYQYRLDGYTTLGLTPEEIHEIGLSEVARIHQEIYDIIEKVNFEGDLNQFFEFMRTSPQFYYPDNQKGRDLYIEQVNVVMDTLKANINQLFNGLPTIPLIVKPVEPYREESAGIAFYQRGKADGSRPGVYYANLYTMEDMPIYKLENLAYHEGIPGHHMQISIALENKGMPSFRKYGGYSVYSEGWALYSETLPKEVGLYKDPYSDFGRLSGELWRACRLVVDTGIHHYRWTREEGINYYLNNTANPEGECVKMVERHIVWPGQAVSYKIGMLTIQELRKHAETELGEKFSLQDFHDVVLQNGAMPMDILQDVVYNWVDNQ